MGDVEIRVNELAEFRRRIQGAANPAQIATLLDHIGQQQEDSARRRIAETKRAPSGKPWPAWSESYAETRKKQHSLLQGTGGLLDSLTHQADTSGAAVRVGSNLIYAATHLFGDKERHIPARPFLDPDGGFADSSDRREMREILRAWLRGML